MKADYCIGARRAGDPCIADYKEKHVGVSNRVSPGTKRAGNPDLMDVPHELFKGDPAKWIGKAVKSMKARGTEGSLRAAHHTKEGKNIPVSTLKKDVAKGGKVAKKAQFALNVRG